MTIRNIFLLLSVAILAASCEKEEETGMDFKLTGIHDTVIERGQSFVIPLKVFYLGGTKEKVTVTATGNGNGVSVAFEPNSGEPNFSLTEYIYANATADTGVFIITVTGTGESKKQFSKSFNLHVKEVSNSKPAIALTQGDTVDHVLNSPWFDPGWVAIDPEDGDISSQVQVSGTVNVNMMANYTLTYSVTDSDGETTTRNRLVRVLNDLIYVNGNYNCTTFWSGPNIVFTTTMAASTTVNNSFTFFKIGDNFQANPIITYNNNNDSIFMASQTFNVSGVINKTYVGKGKLTWNGGTLVTVDLTYTESFTDTVTGFPVVLNKRDLCTRF